MSAIICAFCGKRPVELEEYVEAARDEGITPDEYVREEEGTFNSATGTFACTECYVALGCPSRPHPYSWKAPARIEKP